MLGNSGTRRKQVRLKNFMSNAVRGVKSFVVNKAMSYANASSASSLISSFGSSLNQVKTGNLSGINTALKKSPFESKLGSTTNNPEDDPLGFQHLQYPTDLTGDELGNWILFFTIATNIGANPAFNADLKFGETLNVNPDMRWVGDPPVHDSDTGDGQWQANNGMDLVREHYKEKGITIPRMNKTNTVLTDDATRDLVSGAIALYMPPDIKVSYGADWEAEDTNISGDIAKAVKDIKGMNLAELMTGEGQWDAFTKMIGNAGGAVAQTAAKGVSSLTSGAGMGDWLKLLGKNFGMAMNNRKEMFYNGPGWREFNYSFSFWPRNSDEMNRVQKIIQMFKYHMHPWRDDAWGGRIFRYPSEFEIHYLHRTGINDKLHKISRCALTKCDVSYSPQGSAFKTFGDHSPVTYKVDLSFKELEYLTKQKVKDGY